MDCCPECKGTTGHTHTMTESHKMFGDWGEVAQAGDSGLNVRRSLVECCDCGARFQHSALERKGLA